MENTRNKIEGPKSKKTKEPPKRANKPQGEHQVPSPPFLYMQSNRLQKSQKIYFFLAKKFCCSQNNGDGTLHCFVIEFYSTSKTIGNQFLTHHHPCLHDAHIIDEFVGLFR
jgi:hypothetical protein